MVKTDSLGNLHWQKGLGGVYRSAARCVNLTSDKGYIIIGIINTGHTYAFNDGRGDDLYLVKTDSLGNLKWD